MFDGNAGGGSGISLGGRGGGRHRTRAAGEESRSDFVKRQHKEREARERKRLRELAATQIQAVFRSCLCLRAAKAVHRQTFDKRYSDLTRVGAALPADKKAKFIFHALVSMLRLFAFFFTAAQDEQRLTGLLQLLLLSAEQTDQQACNNVFGLALVTDEGQRRSFLVLFQKMVRAMLRLGRVESLPHLLLSMQAFLFKPAPDFLPVDVVKSAAVVSYIFRRTEVLFMLTSSALPQAVAATLKGAPADDVEKLVTLCCAGLEVCPAATRGELLLALLSVPQLGACLCQANACGDAAQQRPCLRRLVDLTLATKLPLPDACAGLLSQELLVFTRRVWLANNLVDMLERYLLRSQGSWWRWLPWIGLARQGSTATASKTVTSTDSARLAKEFERLNQSAFVRLLIQALDREPPEALLATCQLYFGGDVAESYEPPPEVVQTLAFATPLASKLFPTFDSMLRTSSIPDVFQVLDPPYFASPEATRLRIFCVVYALQLQPMYDYEFFGSANPLRIEEVQLLVPFLNRLAYLFITTCPDRSQLTSTGKALRSSMTSLLTSLYNRHRRKAILKEDAAWIIADSKLLLRRAPVVDLGGDAAEEEEQAAEADAMDDDDEEAPMDVDEGGATSSTAAASRSGRQASGKQLGANGSEQVLEALLEEIPHVLPFDDRVSLLHNVILSDQEQRRDSRAPWSMFSMTRHQIRRNFLVEDGFEAFQGMESEAQLRDVFRVEFIDPDGSPESGIDGGGLFKEFMIHICRHMFDPEFGLFDSTDDNTLYPSPNALLVHERGVEFYVFLGKVVGKAIYEMMLLEPQFSRVFLNRLLGRINEVDDISALDKELHRNMIKIKESENVEELDLTFSVSLSFGGDHEEIDLVPGGRNVRVTNENLTRYLHLLANYKTNVQFQRHVAAFLRGLQHVIPLAWLKMFDPYELNTLISGSTVGFDVRDLKQNTVYSGGYHEGSSTIQWMWQLLENGVEPEDRGRFLMFVTSCSRAPLLGFKTLYPKFCFHRVPDGTRLPTASTCANLMKLPEYTSFEALKTKVLQAIRSEAGFDMS